MVLEWLKLPLAVGWMSEWLYWIEYVCDDFFVFKEWQVEEEGDMRALTAPTPSSS